MKKLKGVVVPIVTPLTEEDTIDVDSLKRLCDHCIDAGLDGIYPCGTTGEMMFLSVEERKLIAETVVAHVNHRATVFIQVGAWNERDTIELAKHAVSIGADGIGVVTPSYFKLRDSELVDFYCHVAASVPEGFPVYLYSIPQNAVNDITPEIAQAIVDRAPNVVGIKYSLADMTRIQNLMLVKNENFSVLAGPDHLFEITVAAGGDGVVSGNSQCIPRHYAELRDLLDAGDYKAAAACQRRINALNNALCAVSNMASYKAVLKREGVLTTSRMRAPFVALTPEEEEALFARVDALLK